MITEEMLTAYALGETSHLSAVEKQALESHVREHAEARTFIAGMRGTADDLARELKSESAVGLADVQQAAIRRAAAESALPPATATARKAGSWTWQTVAMAASVLMVAGVVGLLLPKLGERKMAMRPLPDGALAKRDAGQPSQPSGSPAGLQHFVSPDGSVLDLPRTNTRIEVEKARQQEQDDLKLIDEAFAHAEGEPASATPMSGGHVFTTIPEAGANQGTPQAGDIFSVGGATGRNNADSISLLRPRLDPRFPSVGNATCGNPRFPAPANEMKNIVSQREMDGSASSALPPPPPPAPAGRRVLLLKKRSGGALKRNNTRDAQQAERSILREPLNQNQQTRTPIEHVEKNTEQYDPIVDNAFQRVMQAPLSTFSIDVDTASYSLMRRNVANGLLPTPDSVRIEELINYFPYSYAAPKGDAADPFAAHVEVAQCPWNPEHRLVRIGIKGKEVAVDKRPPSNLVFLVDVSGSMEGPNRLPLVQKSLKMLVDRLGENDHVALAVYAGNSGLVLDSTSCVDKQKIKAAIDNLSAGGGTNGAQGIQLAYDTAAKHFIKNGANRVILCTDGDWNLGVTSDGELVRLITEKAKSGVFLSVLGFGMGNYKDGKMEKMADKGNGNYAYIDGEKEAKKALVEQLSGTLVTIAKDVKIQVEFNPAKADSYRLIGYENRMLAAEDFNNDKKDAGEIGAGHTVTALYEVVPADAGKKPAVPTVDPLEYQAVGSPTEKAYTEQLLTLKIRYKQPDGDTSKLLKFPVDDSGADYAKASVDYKFAAAVAGFGMLLRGSPYSGNATFASVQELAGGALGNDAGGYRAEFIELMKKVAELAKTRKIVKQEAPVQEAPHPDPQAQPAPQDAPPAPQDGNL